MRKRPAPALLRPSCHAMAGAVVRALLFGAGAHLFGALAIAAAPSAADDWPQWRGPLGTGVSPERNLPTEWSEETLAWSAELTGTGVSSPVVAGERVVVTSQTGGDTRRPGRHPQLAREDAEVARAERALTAPPESESIEFVVEAFHRDDGRRLWQHRMPARGDLPAVHEKHNLATPSPIVDGDSVYAWFGTGQLVALSVADGTVLWRRHLGEEVGAFEINWGHGSSPALHGDHLFLLCYHDPRSVLLALDKRTGETRWQVTGPDESRSYSTPTPIETESGPQLVVNSTAGLHAYHPGTGELLWSADGEHRFGVPVPSFVDGVLYASRGYRSGPYLALRPDGRGDVTDSHTLWRVDTGAPYVSSLVVYDGLLYMAADHGVVTAIDPATGERIWRERTGGIFSASPVAGDGKLYLMSETGATFVYAAGRESEVLATNQIEGRIVATPAISDGRIFVRTDERLVAIGGRPGAETPGEALE
ncbi:MAG TPA: PQQ-binding-like beta-propeller repeat protein [Thermoanaerobaculia bacterium]|nr:PQQ-binding-like beta-propeller repeat protein [Thermoanaerobaculia bacterium]